MLCFINLASIKEIFECIRTLVCTCIWLQISHKQGVWNIAFCTLYGRGLNDTVVSCKLRRVLLSSANVIKSELSLLRYGLLEMGLKL